MDNRGNKGALLLSRTSVPGIACSLAHAVLWENQGKEREGKIQYGKQGTGLTIRIIRDTIYLVILNIKKY